MARVKLYRVKEPGRHAVIRPGTTGMFVPDPTIVYREDDILVKTYPWMFQSDEDIVVEDAAANPGDKRRIGRPPLPRDADGNVIR